MADNIDDLIDGAQQPSEDERIRILQRENARLRKQIRERESGWALLKPILESVYDTPSGLHVLPFKASENPAPRETAVLHLTDIHYGKKTETFNASVCEERMLVLCEAVGEIVTLRRKNAGIHSLKLLLGGDMTEGQGIFPGQAHELDVDIVSQVIREGPEAVANVVLFMANLFPLVEVHAVPGNHGRVDRHGDKRLNNDSTFYEIVRHLIQKSGADNVTWDLPYDRPEGREWYARFPICGPWEGMLVHGDQVKGSLGYSWYGWGKKTMRWAVAKESRGFQFLFGGHWHSHGVFEDNELTIMATGSVESNNSYALETMAASGGPKQRLCFFNERWGILNDNFIHLRDPQHDLS